MDVCVELLTDDVWAAEYYKIDFLIVGVDIFDWLHLKERPISLPMVPMNTIKIYMRNEDNWEKSTNRNMRFFWWMIKILYLVIPSYGKNSKNRKMSMN